MVFNTNYLISSLLLIKERVVKVTIVKKIVLLTPILASLSIHKG